MELFEFWEFLEITIFLIGIIAYLVIALLIGTIKLLEFIARAVDSSADR